MGRIKTRTHPSSKRGRTLKKSVRIYISRTGIAGPRAFYACVRAGSPHRAKTERLSAHCAYGRNPRTAIGNAMIAEGKVIKRRKGAFKGVR